MSHLRVENTPTVNQPSCLTIFVGELKKLAQRISDYVMSLLQKLFPSWFTPREAPPVPPPTPQSRPGSLETDWERIPTVIPGILFSGTNKLEVKDYPADIFVNLYALQKFDRVLSEHHFPKKDALDRVLVEGRKRYEKYSEQIQIDSPNAMIAASEVFTVGAFSKESQILQAPRRCESHEEVQKWIESVYFAFEKLAQEKGFAKGVILRGTEEHPRTFAIWARAKECDIFLLDPRGKDESSPISFHHFKCKEGFFDYFAKVAASFSGLHPEENHYWVKPLEARVNT